MEQTFFICSLVTSLVIFNHTILLPYRIWVDVKSYKFSITSL